MGIPKFFRYMSERYPCLSELVREDQIPEFDNLYLDMNGIIHPCSHPDDGNVHFRISEETIFRNIFNYIDKLFFLIKPRKLFFMAVDGVAPRAKMNQQRSRRFRSAKDAEVLEKDAVRRGEKLPDTARFDSNCITPGTEFMVRLQDALKYFVKLKMSTNPLWQRCRIILSGHETPGEGEHKIMEYIRYLKSQPGYDNNTRHCLYGLDADLIVLGLCTHEMHFSLLREEVSFGKKAKKASIEETRFFLLHLNLLREYLELEFGSLKVVEGKKFSIYKIIDDWILMGFLVGNDFIPHLPNFHINTNALPLLYEIYKRVWPQMDGYLNDNGNLNLDNFEIFMRELAERDLEMYKEISADLKYFEGKRGKNNEIVDIPEAFDFDVEDMDDVDLNVNLAKLIEDSNKMFGSDDDLSDDEAMLEKEFRMHKRNYYITKLNYPEMTEEVLAEQTECYIRALQWILFYYYRGVSSWGWFYPHHYAPYASDIKNFKHLKLEFSMGKPFLPFEQLLAVLPAASKELLPEAYRDLMTNPNSKIIEYYPNEFQTDLNGKRQEWEAVVLIPFIDEVKLLQAMSERFSYLQPEEQKRNIHGPMLQYDYTDVSQGECPGIYSFKKFDNTYCTETAVWRDQVKVGTNYLDSDISKWPAKKCHLPGFPTMKYLSYTGELQKARVKVFEQPSRNDTMILFPEIKSFDGLDAIASKYLDKIVYVGWPHLVKSKVTAIITPEFKATANGIEEIQSRIFHLHLKHVEEHTFNRMGIKFRETKFLVYVNTLASVEYVVGNKGKMISTNIWSNSEISYPLQGVVMNIRKEDEMIEEKIEDFYPVGTPIFLLSSPYFGCEGKILDPKLVYSCGRIQVNITVIPEPQLSEARGKQTEAEMSYYNNYEFAIKTGLNANVVARITGSVFIIHGSPRGDLPENTPKTNIGLNLKSKKSDQQVAGYVRKQGTTWQYSLKTMDLIISYYEVFPEVFNLLASNTGGRDEFFETNLFPPDTSDKKLSDLTAWLKKQSHNKAERVPCGTKWVEMEAMDAIKEAVESLKKQPVKCIKLQVKPHLLLKQGLEIPQAFRSKSKIRLFDRIVVAKRTYQVPVGYKGTVIAIHPLVDPNPVRIECVKQVETFIEVLFDKELPDIGDENEGELKRIARVAQTSVLVVYQPLDEVVVAPLETSTNQAQNVTSNKQNSDRSIYNNGLRNRDMAFFVEPPKDDRNFNQQQQSRQTRKPDEFRNKPQTVNISKFVQPPPMPEQYFQQSSTAPTYSNRRLPETSISSAQFTSSAYLAKQHGQSRNPSQRDTTLGSSKRNNARVNYPPMENVMAPPIAGSQPMQFKDNQDPVGMLSKDLNDLKLQNLPNVAESTEALRKLLGMSSSNSNFDSSGDKQSINFPKPPSNWTKDASQHRSKNSDMNQPSQTHSQSIPFNNVQPIQPYNSQCYTNMPVHVDKKYAPNNHNNNGDTQMCPSRQKRVSNISSGQSAFIPLQAMKSIRKNEQKGSNSKSTGHHSQNAAQSINEQSSGTASNTRDQEAKPSNSAQNSADETKKKTAKQTARKPKIAANFNLKG
ncbi:5'-3' exoribonuclease 1 isoform X1 [Hermetia illucens]|nr:5'-3' exoribonuclease 1 isoform X1 [Hermetia illucens]